MPFGGRQVELEATVNVMRMHSHIKLSFNVGTGGAFVLRHVPAAFNWTNEASYLTNDDMVHLMGV